MTTNIFILNWNSAESTRECLNNVIESDEKNLRVLLINNISNKFDLDEIRYIYNSLKNTMELYLIENEANLGYAGGNNEGFRFLTTNKFTGNILILNPDILISKNTISEMNKALIANVGIVTARTINPQGKILFDAIKLKGFSQKNIITDQQSISTDYSQGSCMLIRRDIVNNIGLFDERFFLYWEEVDFSLRVKNLGEKLISITSTQVIRNSNSISRQPLAFYYSVRNARLIKDKHKSDFTTLSYLLYLLKMLVLTLKFIPNLKIFRQVITNYFSALIDSSLDKYYSK